MNLAFGASSYIFRSFPEYYKKKFIKITSKNYLFPNDYIHYEGISSIDAIKEKKINYCFIFIGVNFKNKKYKDSYNVNFKIPSEIIKNISEKYKKVKFILFGSFKELMSRSNDENSIYVEHKSSLKKFIETYSKTKKIEYVWIYLPLIYGKNQNKSFFISWLKNISKYSDNVYINEKYNSEYLLNVNILFKYVFLITNNWKKYKNKKIIPKCEGPFYIWEIVKKIIYKKNKVIYKNKKFKNKTYIKPNIELPIKFNNFSKFFSK
jgi:hypothetical protein